MQKHAEALLQTKAQGTLLTASDREFLNLVDAVGPRRVARVIKSQIDTEIHANDTAFLSNKATIGTPTDRLLTRLHLVSNEAVLSIKNIGKNIAQATVYAANRADAGIQLGFDALVDYTQGAVAGTMEGIKAGSHAATVKPIKAAVNKTYN